MTKKENEELKQLFLDEIQFRIEWRAAVDTLQKLVDPVSKHNRKCCEFWDKNLNKASEILLIMDNGKSYKIIRPDREEAKQEAYLPYGIDFHECETIDLTK